MERLVLHLGAHKTGTTLVQESLRRDRKRLAGRGWTTALRGKFEPADDRRLLAWRLNKIPLEDLRDLYAGIARSLKGDRVVVSEEELLGGVASFRRTGVFYPAAGEALGLLLDVFRPETVTVVYHVRRQDTFVESVYSQLVKVGNDQTWSSFTTGIETWPLRWTPVLEALTATVGRDAVTCRYFEDIRLGTEDFLRTFYRDALLPIEPDLGDGLDAVNGGLSGPALVIARLANQVLSDQRERYEVRRFLEERFPASTHGKARLIDDTRRREILLRLEDDNVRLHTEFMTSSASESPYLVSAIA